jgi:hypothetical protein
MKTHVISCVNCWGVLDSSGSRKVVSQRFFISTPLPTEVRCISCKRPRSSSVSAWWIYMLEFSESQWNIIWLCPEWVAPPAGRQSWSKYDLIYLTSRLSLIFHKMYKHLEDWHKVLHDFNEVFQKQALQGYLEDHHIDPTLDISSDQRHFLSGLQCLCSLGHHHDQMVYNKVLVNIMTLVSCVWWFSMVRPFVSFLSSFSLSACRALRTCHLIGRYYCSALKGGFSFLQIFFIIPMPLIRRAGMLGLERHTWESVYSIPDLPDLIPRMRNLLHLATSFSPLIVLVPKKFTSDSIRRDHLLAVRTTFPSYSAR